MQVQMHAAHADTHACYYIPKRRYQVVRVKCELYDGQWVMAETLEAAPLSLGDPSTVLPSLRYIQILRDGARHHGVDPAYCDMLDAQPGYVIEGWRQKAGKIVIGVCVLIMFLPMVLVALVMAGASWWVSWGMPFVGLLLPAARCMFVGTSLFLPSVHDCHRCRGSCGVAMFAHRISLAPAPAASAHVMPRSGPCDSVRHVVPCVGPFPCHHKHKPPGSTTRESFGLTPLISLTSCALRRLRPLLGGRTPGPQAGAVSSAASAAAATAVASVTTSVTAASGKGGEKVAAPGGALGAALMRVRLQLSTPLANYYVWAVFWAAWLLHALLRPLFGSGCDMSVAAAAAAPQRSAPTPDAGGKSKVA